VSHSKNLLLRDIHSYDSFVWVASRSETWRYMWAMAMTQSHVSPFICKCYQLSSFLPAQVKCKVYGIRLTHMYSLICDLTHSNESRLRVETQWILWNMTHLYESCHIMRISQCVKYQLMSHRRQMNEIWRPRRMGSDSFMWVTSHSVNLGGMWGMIHWYESCHRMRMSQYVKYPLMSHGRQMNEIWLTYMWSCHSCESRLIV